MLLLCHACFVSPCIDERGASHPDAGNAVLTLRWQHAAYVCLQAHKVAPQVAGSARSLLSQRCNPCTICLWDDSWSIEARGASCADGQGRLSSPAVLSVCGLISAFISFRKNWIAI